MTWLPTEHVHTWLPFWWRDDPQSGWICTGCDLDVEQHRNHHGECITTVRGKAPHMADYDDFIAWQGH